MKYKTCTKCGIEKSVENFNKQSSQKDGYNCHCKSCRSEYRKINAEKIALQKRLWADRNKEKLAERYKAYRAENIEKCKKYDIEKYKKNKESIIKRVAEYQKKYPERNRKAGQKYRRNTPDKQAAKSAKRRAKLMQATPAWIEDEFEQFYIEEIYHLAKLHREITNIEFHVDHIVPLTSDSVCGLHCSANLQLLTDIDNIVKLNRYWPNMW